MFRPDTRADLTRYEVFVEVDGKPYKITRTIQNWITYGFDTNQGSSQGRRSDYGTFGQKIHGNQAIVLQFGGHRTAKPKDWIKDKNGKYILNDPEHLKNEFKILLLDHYKNPQIIEMYDRKEAFESPNARVKVMGKTWKKIPKIPFWLFQGDGKDRYYDYDLKTGRGFYKYRNKDFETQSYFIKHVSDEAIDKILEEYPDIKPEGIYRLESYFLRSANDRLKNDNKRGYRGVKIGQILKENPSCYSESTKHFCKFYTGKKDNGKWSMVEGRSLPQKLYFDPDSKINAFNKTFVYKFELNGKTIRIQRDSEYLNRFLNFDTREYYGFSQKYYKTREHK